VFELLVLTYTNTIISYRYTIAHHRCYAVGIKLTLALVSVLGSQLGLRLREYLLIGRGLEDLGCISLLVSTSSLTVRFLTCMLYVYVYP